MGRPASTEKPPPLTPEQAALVADWLAECSAAAEAAAAAAAGRYEVVAEAPF